MSGFGTVADMVSGNRPTSIQDESMTTRLRVTVRSSRGSRQVAITHRRTMQDFVYRMRWLVDEACPDVPVIRLVVDRWR